MARARRGRGEGSVYERANGLWAGVLDLGLDANGKRRRKFVYGATKRVVLEKLTKLRGDAASGVLLDVERMTVAQLLARWLSACKQSVRQSTHDRYTVIVNKQLNEFIGGQQLSKLKALHVQAMLEALRQKKASPRKLELAHAILSRALNQAVRWKVVNENVCDQVNKPRSQRKPVKTWTPEQARAFLAKAKGTRLHALYVLALSTGMRHGELLGLQWPDIDLKAAAIHVQRSMEELGGRCQLTDLKTLRSKRRIDLDAGSVAALKAHREKELEMGRRGGLVFCAPTGQPIRKSNLRQRSFQKIIAAADLPVIRFHDLRHTAASLMLVAGVHPKVVQERLGHATIAMTLDTYSHLLPSTQKDAAALVGDLLAGPGSTAQVLPTQRTQVETVDVSGK